METKFYRKIKKKLHPQNVLEKMMANKKLSFFIMLGFALFLYAFLNSNGILHRIQLEKQKKVMLEKIRIAEEEQQKLHEQSKALDGDSKAIEKVAREKYGMVRDGEKVYKVAPKKQ